MTLEKRTRDSWIFDWSEALLHDLRYSVRALRRNRGMAAVAVLSIALGIGAITAVFSVLDALMLRILPVRNPEELVRLVNPSSPGFGFSYSQYERFRGLRGPFSSVAAIFNSDRSNIAVSGTDGGIEPSALQLALVSGDYFATLGIASAIGRVFVPDDDSPPNDRPVAVISYGYWERRFGLSPNVLDATLTLNDTVYSIIGVTSRGFSGDWVGKPTDVWIPLAMQSRVVLERRDRRVPWLRLVARLKPGVPLKQAQAAAQVIYTQTIREMPNLRPQMRESLLQERVELE
ncbi:MAG: ABC transporter permease, partial [Bryobacteraceae bacterium]